MVVFSLVTLCCGIRCTRNDIGVWLTLSFFFFFSFFVQQNREGMKITEMKQKKETISYHIVLYKQQQINSFH